MRISDYMPVAALSKRLGRPLSEQEIALGVADDGWSWFVSDDGNLCLANPEHPDHREHPATKLYIAAIRKSRLA